MLKCRQLSLTIRSNHNSHLSSLKNPKIALKKEKLTEEVPVEVSKNKNEWISLFPRGFCRRSQVNSFTSERVYLTSDATAEKIAKYLTSLPDQSITVVETNPGLGKLTELLLRSGVKDLRLFEGRKEFFETLTNSYAKAYSDRVQLQHVDLFRLKKMCVKMDESLNTLPKSAFKDDINFRLFAVTGSSQFFHDMIRSVAFDTGLLALGRCELYMVIPSYVYCVLAREMKAGALYSYPISILFQLFFEYELVDKFPRTDFLPYVINPRKYTKTLKGAPKKAGWLSSNRMSARVEPELMYFVRIVRKKDIYQLVPKILELWHFVKLCCRRRKNAVIPFLEKIIPGSGAELLIKYDQQISIRPQPTYESNLCETPPTTVPSMTISHKDYYGDLNIFTEVEDLTASQILTLFHEFSLLPDYASSSFAASVDANLIRLGHTVDEFERNEDKHRKR